MIIYGFFIGLSFLGMFFLIMGIQSEIALFSIIGPMLGAPGFLPESMGFFLLSFFIMFFVMFGLMIRIKMTGVSHRFDKLPKGKSIFNFMFRDGQSMDILGERRPGMGVFDLPGVGVVVDIGRLPTPGSVYRFGGKNIRYALQDINYTPNPKFTNVYSFFTSLGFNNMEDVRDVFNGYNPSLIAKVWEKLVDYHPEPPEDKVVDNIKQMNKRELKQNNILWKQSKEKRKSKKDTFEEIDEVIERRKI